jgi:hypothetical protein
MSRAYWQSDYVPIPFRASLFFAAGSGPLSLRYTHRLMRHCVAIVLVVLFGSLTVMPLFANSSESALPSCCRKNGKHHCAMVAQQATSSESAVLALGSKCPCFPHSTVATQAQVFTPATRQAVFSDLVRHPAVAPQTEARFRISQDRSRQKRGPPVLHFS